MPRSNPRSARRKRKRALDHPMIRVLLAAAATVLIVLVCIAATSLMPKVDPSPLESAASPGTPTPVPLQPGGGDAFQG